VAIQILLPDNAPLKNNTYRDAIIDRCEPTTHRSVRMVVLPPPHHPHECLREPTAAA